MKLKSKLKKILFVLPIFISCFCVSVSAYNEVSFGNLKFGSPSFRTRISDSDGYIDPSNDVFTEYNQSSYDDSGISIYTYTVKSGGSFGGSLDYYRCMRGSISVPVSNGKKYLYMTVTPYIYNGSSGVSSFDISLGESTYFSNGGITSNPFLNVESTREGTSVKLKIDLETYDTVYFQIGTKIYSTWTNYTLAFSDISLVSEDGSSLIINNQNQNTQNILNNQNENADKIIGSLGGNDDYNSPGSGDLGNLEDSESALINGNKAQSDEANNRINDNVLGSIQRLASSFGATAAMFQDMGLKLPDLSVLLYFSLILGIVPIIVGLSINNLRGHDAKVARERRREQYKSKGG